MHYFIDASRSNPDVLGKTVLGYAEGFQKFRQEYLTGMNGGVKIACDLYMISREQKGESAPPMVLLAKTSAKC